MRERKRETVRDKKKLLWENMLRTTSAISPREKSNSTAILSSCPPTCIPTPSCSPVTQRDDPLLHPHPTHSLTLSQTHTHACLLPQKHPIWLVVSAVYLQCPSDFPLPLLHTARVSNPAECVSVHMCVRACM